MGLTNYVVSGVPAVYGRAIVLTNPSNGNVSHYDRGTDGKGVITVVDADLNARTPQTRDYFVEVLDNRFINPPTGWNAFP